MKKVRAAGIKYRIEYFTDIIIAISETVRNKDKIAEYLANLFIYNLFIF